MSLIKYFLSLSAVNIAINASFGIPQVMANQVVGGDSAYSEGHVWKRRNAWAGSSEYGSTDGNPLLDSEGNGVWYLEWTLGDRANSNSPWYEEPSHLMFWDLWDPDRAKTKELWVREDNAEPIVSKWGMSHSRSAYWMSYDYQSLVRWQNPTGTDVSVSISGDLDIDWGGKGRPSTDVDVIVGKRSVTNPNSVTPVMLKTVTNPDPEGYGEDVRLNIDIPLLTLNADDSLVVSLRAHDFPTVDDSWVSLRDNIAITYRASGIQSVPQEYLFGEPTAVNSSEPKIQVWQEYYDGPTYVRVVGADTGMSNYQLGIVSTGEVSSSLLPSPENLSNLEFIGDKALLWSGDVGETSETIAILPELGAQTMLGWDVNDTALESVEIGEEAKLLFAESTMLIGEQLEQLMPSSEHRAMSIELERTNAHSPLVFTWGRSDGKATPANIQILTDQDTLATPVSFELSDTLSSVDNNIEVSSTMYSGLDKLEVESLGAVIKIVAMDFQIGSMHRPDLIDFSESAQPANALSLPKASSAGTPDYNPGTEKGLYIWKGEEGNWSVRAAAGGGSAIYRGTISSSEPIESLAAFKLEGSDNLELVSPYVIEFKMKIAQAWEDGFDFTNSQNAIITLDITNLEDNDLSEVRIGSKGWQVSQLPVDIQ